MRFGVCRGAWLVTATLTLTLGGLVIPTPLVHAQLSFVTPESADEPEATDEPVAPPSLLPGEDVHGLLRRGQVLEAERRWGEALSLYEEGVRQFPDHGDLAERLELSRIHYDLGRRYHDESFRESTARMTEEASLDLYAEVLLKIQSHYVHEPDWRELVEHGSRDLQVALEDPLFLESNLGETPAAKVDRFGRDLAVLLSRQKVATRQEARDAVAHVARYAHQQLGLPESVVVLEYTCGATNSLDPYSAFLTAGQLDEVYSQIEGNFVGLGIELKAHDGALLIVKVIPGSPAERGGLHDGDTIVAVDGQSTRELSTDQAANMLQGQEGTVVEVTAVTPGKQPRRLRIRREEIEVPSVDGVRIVDKTYGIGYMRLTCFQKTTSRDLDAALWKLHRAGMRSLILDLRGNPGGLLTTSVDVVDKFIERGTIVSTRGRGKDEDYSYSAHSAGTWKVPLVVLIDGDSASASEIFAGAIRDHHRGVLVGTRSYGKGSVQGIFPLNSANAGIRLTTAKFYSPTGRAYSDVGVNPDVEVRETARPNDVTGQRVDTESDAALDAAVRESRRQLARR